MAELRERAAVFFRACAGFIEFMIIHKNWVKDAGRLVFWYPIRWLVLAMPPSFVYVLGGVFGKIDTIISGGRRRMLVLENLRAGLGIDRRTAQGLFLRSCQDHARNNLEFLRYPSIVRSGQIAPIAEVEGLDHLRNAMSGGRGVILATAHFGAKQLLQVVLPMLGFQVTQLNYHAPPDKLTFVQRQVSQRLRMRIESCLSARFLSVRGSLRKAFECLKNGEILILAADGSGVAEHMDRNYHPVSFLGTHVLLPTNFAVLAEKTSATVVPVFVVREGGRHRVVFEQPLSSSPDCPADLARAFGRILEKHIRARPELWEFWEEFRPGHLIRDLPASGEVPEGKFERAKYSEKNQTGRLVE